MSRPASIARRSFLIGSSVIAGGVAFGVYLVRRTPANPLLDGKTSDQAVFNPWVWIDARGSR